MSMLKGVLAGSATILVVFTAYVEIAADRAGQIGGWSLVILMFLGPFLVGGLCVVLALAQALNRKLEGSDAALVAMCAAGGAVAPLLIFSKFASVGDGGNGVLPALSILMALGGAVGGYVTARTQ